MTEKLRALALAATPGPWMWDSDPIKGDPLDRVRFRVVATGRTITRCYYSSSDNMAQKEAEWIAAANPTNILALLDEIDKLKEENAGLRKDAERLDYMDNTGSTVEMMPGYPDFYPMHFRVGGMLNTTDPSLRNAIDAAIDAAKGDSHE
jgi:hypothetical protein